MNLKGKGLAVLSSTLVVTGLFSAAGFTGAAHAASVQQLTFDFPVAVAGPLAQDVTALVQKFNQTHPGIQVTPQFAGDYQTAMTKVQTGLSSNTEPDVGVLLSTDVYSLLDMHAILPINHFATGAAGASYLHSFYPAFMSNSVVDGTTWGVPFQRSTVVMYYNKDEFKKAGLNPNRPPSTWAQLVADAKKLTNKSQWGLEIPTSGTTYWLFQPFAVQAGQNVVGSAANKVYFDTPKVEKALQFFSDLSRKDNVEPSGLIGWTTAPSDFETGHAAMIYHSSGSLTKILQSSKFAVGVAPLPGDTQRGTVTGGGNLYIFDTHNAAKEKAAYEFVQWLTSPANAATWSMETGYVATSPAAYATPAMKAYLKKTPQADVARQEMAFAAKELSTHDGEQVQNILSTACQQVLTGSSSAAQALKSAQSQANALLAKYSK